MRVNPGKKGFFVHPIIYKYAKKIRFLRKSDISLTYVSDIKTLNIRSSFYINRIRDVMIYAHDGRDLLPSHPHDFIKNKYTFRIGQITYNRHLPEKRSFKANRDFIINDMKKKRGLILKIARRKKYTYFKYGSSS